MYRIGSARFWTVLLPLVAVAWLLAVHGRVAGRIGSAQSFGARPQACVDGTPRRTRPPGWPRRPRESPRRVPQWTEQP